MEPLKPLTNFIETAADDMRINVTHIAVYLSVLYQWSLNQFESPISVCREDIMKMAKVNARQTYNKTINDLHDFGYIRYIPSPNQFLKSLIYINRV